MSLYLPTFVKTHTKTCSLQIKADERIISICKSWYGWRGWWRRYLMNIICRRRVFQVYTRRIRGTLSLISLHSNADCFLDFNDDLLFLNVVDYFRSQSLVLFKSCWTNTFLVCSPGDNSSSSFTFEKIQCIINKIVKDIYISCKTSNIVDPFQL